MKLSKFTEVNIINNLSKLIKKSSKVIVGIGDDAAVIEDESNKFLLFATDLLLEDIHFSLKSNNFTPEKLGYKALAVNLSDIAAMGGHPEYATVSVIIPSELDFDFLDSIYKGIVNLANEYDVKIVGGDSSCGDKIMINISLIGSVSKKNLTLRSTANPGDYVFVTGYLGGSIRNKHFDFRPRLKEAEYLTSNFNVTSMIDISDGLISDAYRIAQASKVGIQLYKDKIPLSADVKSLDNALYDGEDFELLFTVDKKSYNKLLKKSSIINDTKVTFIGVIVEGQEKVHLIDSNGKRKLVSDKGYDHFK